MSTLLMYRRVIGTPGAMGFFPASVVARLGVAMTGFAILWTVNDATGSLAFAGAATGAFALAEGLCGPQVARVVDRLGQARVLPWVAAAHAGAIVGLVASASLRSTVAIVVFSAMAGATIPQPGALSAARWSHLVPDRDQLTAAFSIEAAVNDVVFIAGPALVGILAASVGPTAGSLCAGALVVTGVVVIATARSTQPAAVPRAAASGPRLFRPVFVVLLAVNLALGFYFASLQIGVTAFAQAHGGAALAGVLLATGGVSSLICGLVYGSRRHPWPPARVLAIVSVGLVVSVLALSIVASIPWMIVAVAITGCAVAPVLITSSVLIQRTTAPGVLTQAFTWVNSASAAGIAVAAPLVGSTVESHGPQAGFLAAAALVALMPVVLVIGMRWLRTP